MNAPRSDAEKLAKTRLLLAALAIYLVSMGFLVFLDEYFYGKAHLLYSRFATVLFFMLLLRQWLRLVRVKAPPTLQEARRLMEVGKYQSAREKYHQMVKLGARSARRLNRARKILQNGLAISVPQEARFQIGCCSLYLGELERAIKELGECHADLPQRADIAIQFAEALLKTGKKDQAAEVLKKSAPYMDALDLAAVESQPELKRALDPTAVPEHSIFHQQIFRERLILGGLVGIAILHGILMVAGKI